MRRQNRIFQNLYGFTTIEMISVILVMGILAVLILPRFNQQGFGIQVGAQVMRSDLRLVQRLALARDPQVLGAIGITFTNGQTSYTIPDPAGIVSTTRDLPSGVTISSATKTISYNSFGEPEFAGASDTVQITDGVQTLTLTIERFTGLVTLS